MLRDMEKRKFYQHKGGRIKNPWLEFERYTNLMRRCILDNMLQSTRYIYIAEELRHCITNPKRIHAPNAT